MAKAIGYRQFAYFFCMRVDSELTAFRELSSTQGPVLAAIRKMHERSPKISRRGNSLGKSPQEWSALDVEGIVSEGGISFSTQLVTPVIATLYLWSSSRSAVFDWMNLPEFGVAQIITERVTQAIESIIIEEEINLDGHLTAREIECLQWVSVGKSAWETASIIGVSEHAVVFHIKNAMSKFRVSTRRQAVARAQLLGLVD
ncbi:helix-turn-helix domain-containing protein [Caballeronia zhejiangensis]|uniref:helix-turn-helix domain-containing protein n=1 Tax=Caballeronia zhejiangensis TaxID=871203 RepID=UPI0024461A82|nr:helix-turn-helix transcriptional regulator [Caballeronia zhejiangensis]